MKTSSHPAHVSKIHLIVEGHGDAQAVPLLVRRLLEDHGLHQIQLTTPQISGGLDKTRKRLGDYLRYGLKNQCPILWVLDCDDKADGQPGCPVRHAESLRTLVEKEQISAPQRVEFAFFVREFESLFLVEQQALRDYYRLPPSTNIPDTSHLRRDAKGEISRLLPKSNAYKETMDQARITARLDLATCRNKSRDFRHFEAVLLRLCCDN